MLSAICAVAIMTTPEPFRDWGLETMTMVRREYKLPARGLYADALVDGKKSGPAFNWGVGVLIPALVGAAKFDPAWKADLRAFVDASHVYWNDKGPVPGYDVLPGPKDVDRYYDDNQWMVMALAETYDVLGDRKYLTWAEDTLKYVLSGEDDKLGGGIYWHEPKKESKNTCSNAPAAAAALAVYERTKNRAYLLKAGELYAWTKRNLQDPKDLLLWDNMKLDGTIGRMKWSYNTALMIRSAAELGRLTGKQSYKDEAEAMALASERKWIDPATGAIADGGRFAHLLLDSWTFVPTPDRQAKARRALEWLHANGRNDRGLYGGQFNAPPKPDQKRFELIDEVSAARAYFMAP